MDTPKHHIGLSLRQRSDSEAFWSPIWMPVATIAAHARARLGYLAPDYRTGHLSAQACI